MTWSLNSTNEKCIAICRKQGAGGTYEVISIEDAGTTSFIDLTVDTNTFYYKIMAVGNLGGEGYSNEAQEESGDIGLKPVAVVAS